MDGRTDGWKDGQINGREFNTSLAEVIRIMGEIIEVILFSHECVTLTFITMVVSCTFMGNWSVSQPKSGEPVLESMEPSMPILETHTFNIMVPTHHGKQNSLPFLCIFLV